VRGAWSVRWLCVKRQRKKVEESEERKEVGALEERATALEKERVNDTRVLKQKESEVEKLDSMLKVMEATLKKAEGKK
jgi:hypothetical protein